MAIKSLILWIPLPLIVPFGLVKQLSRFSCLSGCVIADRAFPNASAPEIVNRKPESFRIYRKICIEQLKWGLVWRDTWILCQWFCCKEMPNLSSHSMAELATVNFATVRLYLKMIANAWAMSLFCTSTTERVLHLFRITISTANIWKIPEVCVMLECVCNSQDIGF